MVGLAARRLCALFLQAISDTTQLDAKTRDPHKQIRTQEPLINRDTSFWLTLPWGQTVRLQHLHGLSEQICTCEALE